MPFLEDVPVLGLVLKAYSPRLVVSIGLERVFAKGLAHGFMRFSIQPMLTRRYGLSGAMYQRLSTLYALGWSVNSFTAIADTFALFGYTKRWYCVVCTLGCGVFGLLYGLLPAKESSAKPAAAFMFLTALFLANVDTFASAIYSRRIRRNPASGAALVSWAWGCALFGAMLAAAVQGSLTDHNVTQVGIYIAAGLLFFLSTLFIFNVFGEQPNRVARVEDAKADYIIKRREERAPGQKQHDADLDFDDKKELVKAVPEGEDEEDLAGFVEPEVDSVLWGVIEINKEVVTRNWLIIIYCCLNTAAVVATAVVTILGTRWDMMWACVAMTIAVCGFGFFMLPLIVAKAGTFIYLFNIFYLQLPGVLNTFYVAKPKCLPDGPHFNFTFYNLMNGIIGNVCSIIGISIFAHCCQNLSYRAIMGSSAIIIPLISMFDLIIVERWNMYIGIPDHATYILGEGVIYSTMNMLISMPAMLLMSRVAPRGSESMVLALLSAVARVGSSTSSSLGYLLMETIWPVVTRGQCDYDNAPWLLIAGHIVLPLFIVPLAFLLLPASRICATLDENGDEVEEVIFPDADMDVQHAEADTAASPTRAEWNGTEQRSRVSVDDRPHKSGRVE
ncbi:biopterin transporter putative (BT1) [Leptomonas pyrrhocoris]|uniref:Biopterin transporter putative (BT1) n=1 Tax=Leptomonas pyrrhocoris TaxID=157538 RepID=A0A0M9GBD7_LEPPY|nr:biopterin transporter putative (BT1) [Leptomonas pyrrhocoris]KPA86656.1 biopterin transporter putative (BT1) [Leptomonas pyrrhocoris]|eukprot:XP_015665095.1 biopterin transporter putative (BT1) [Leptomonas pyrrhocoris]